MMRWRFVATSGLIGVLAVATGAAHAGTRIYVSLAGRDDAAPKLGRPGICVRVHASDPDAVSALRGELARELVSQVHTRDLAQEEPGDYDLTVTLKDRRISGEVVTIPFEAVLESAAGRPLWRIEGRAEVSSDPVDASVFDGIGRNVISALIHDGWVQPRYDPDDPPPPAPVVRIDSR
jgi:hypothetical protein